MASNVNILQKDNFYERGEYPAVELVTLGEDIILTPMMAPTNASGANKTGAENQAAHTSKLATITHDTSQNKGLSGTGIDGATSQSFIIPIRGIMGKFIMSIMTPTMDKEEIVEKNELSNFVELEIPFFLVMYFMKPAIRFFYLSNHMLNDSSGDIVPLLSFEKTEEPYIIPKGTKFLAQFKGGILSYENLRIVGLYDYNVDKEMTSHG